MKRALFSLLLLLPALAHADEVAPAPPPVPQPPVVPEVPPTPPVVVVAPPRAAPDRKPDLVYDPGRGITLRAGKARLRFRVVIQPMVRYGHADGAPVEQDDTIDLIVRRARLSWDVRLPQHLRLRFDVNVKNMRFEIHNMYGSWAPSKELELQAGFLKAPGGLERESYSFDLPFIERSCLTFFNYDHEVGIKAIGKLADHHLILLGSITRDPPPVEGGDPEDSPVIPPSVEKEDLTRPASKWNAAGRVVLAPSEHFELGLGFGLRLRPEEPDFGDIPAEPYDTAWGTNHPYRGTMLRGTFDLALSLPHLRLSLEAAARRDGEQLRYDTVAPYAETDLGGHLDAEAAYLIVGWSPSGHYGPAVDNAPLLDGWQLVTRFQAMRVNPIAEPVSTFAAAELGVEWQLTPALRLQVDAAIEHFNDAATTAIMINQGATRVWAQTWATWRL